MGQCNRLRFLQMGKARHIGFQVFLHDPIDHFKKIFQFFVDLVDLIPHIQAHIQSHLIISAASGM